MRQKYKKKRLEKIINIVITCIQQDKDSCGDSKSRTLDRWLDIINTGLKGRQGHICNTNEMVSIFKKLNKSFQIEKHKHCIPIGDDVEDSCKKTKVFYKIETRHIQESIAEICNNA